MTVQSVKHHKVEVKPLLKPILPNEGVVMLGSCFAQYMADRMVQAGYDVISNPLGTLFNPFSIFQTVCAALKSDHIDFPVFQADNEWRCWWANTKVRAAERSVLETELRQRFSVLGAALRKARHLVVTLGTNVCYRLTDGMVVTNCQRQPDKLFEEWRAPLAEVIDVLSKMVEMLKDENSDLQVILTVSPYRYHKYGYHGSQLSKATLLLAEEELVTRYPNMCTYFPAYEILLDELRDYRFYAPDGHHPSEEATDLIWERFSASAFR